MVDILLIYGILRFVPSGQVVQRVLCVQRPWETPSRQRGKQLKRPESAAALLGTA